MHQVSSFWYPFMVFVVAIMAGCSPSQTYVAEEIGIELVLPSDWTVVDHSDSRLVIDDDRVRAVDRMYFDDAFTEEIPEDLEAFAQHQIEMGLDSGGLATAGSIQTEVIADYRAISFQAVSTQSAPGILPEPMPYLPVEVVLVTDEKRWLRILIFEPDEQTERIVRSLRFRTD